MAKAKKLSGAALAALDEDSVVEEVAKVETLEKTATVKAWEGPDGAFKELSDVDVKELPYEEAREYWIAHGSWKANQAPVWTDESVEVVHLREGRIEIIDPLGSSDGAKLQVKAPPEWMKRWHPYWSLAEEVEDFKEKGYRTVGFDGEDAVVKTWVKTGESSRVVKRGGKDELVLMAVDRSRFEAHIKAAALRSENQVNAKRSYLDEKLDKARVKVRSIEVDEEEEEVRV